MDNVLVDRKTLQRVIDYVTQNEEQDFQQCQREEWTEDQLENHVFSLALNLQTLIDNQ